MVLTQSLAPALYRRCAPYYDRLGWLFRLAGADVNAHRRRVVEALNVSPGDTVVDLGCGTGLNFPWLEGAVTASGHIIGVDLTDAMLREAQNRVDNAGWTIVQSVLSDFLFKCRILNRTHLF